MIEIREITQKHKLDVFKYMKLMYQSSAVDHIVEDEVLLRTLEASFISNNNFYGYEILVDDVVKGFGFLTKYFSSEIGGYTVQFEDLYIDNEFRSQGIGRKYFHFLMNKFPAKRYRLEVTKENCKAIELYKRLGFKFLSYRQMVKEED